MAAQGFFLAAHGFFAARGFLAAHGFFPAQGFLAAHGFVAAHGFFGAAAVLAAHGFDAAAPASGVARARAAAPATRQLLTPTDVLRFMGFLLTWGEKTSVAPGRVPGVLSGDRRSAQDLTRPAKRTNVPPESSKGERHTRACTKKQAAAGFLADCISDPSTPRYRQGLDRASTLRLACHDLKAFYMASVLSQPGARSAQAAERWFWDKTVAGKALVALSAVRQE